MNKYAIGFRWLLVAGFLKDWFFAAAGIYLPNAVLGLYGGEPSTLPVWPGLVFLLLFLNTLFFVPAALHPFRYQVNGWLAIALRGGTAAILLFELEGHPRFFGWPDLVLAGGQALLMVMALARRRGNPKRGEMAAALKLRETLLLPKAISVVTLIAGGLAVVVWNQFLREVPQEFESMEERFKYGSVGTEEQEGIPYWIWLTMPRVFPEHLPSKPGGYASLGTAWEDGEETPIGFSKKTIGFPRIGINCALCHTSSYRKERDSGPTFEPTGPSHQFDVLSYQRFLFRSAADPRFTPGVLLDAIEYNIELSWLEKLAYRYVIIPRTRQALLEQKSEWEWTQSRPDWGPGRIDPFNPVKFDDDVLGLNPNEDDTVGNSDMMALWNLGEHEGFAWHWDGLNTNLTEVVLSSAIGDGATHASLPVDKLEALRDWLKEVPPPDYPYSVDQNLADQGEAVYLKYCAECHAFGGKRTGHVIPLNELGTDRHRLEMWTEEAAQRYEDYADDYPWDFRHFRTTEGYVSKAMDGIWLRGPYLHNGSVPTLRDLLNPAPTDTELRKLGLDPSDTAKDLEPDRVRALIDEARTMEVRPPVFYRGSELFNPDGVGFRSEAREATALHLYDTRKPGNGNQGHDGEQYGTELSDKAKEALVEYLKTQ